MKQIIKSAAVVLLLSSTLLHANINNKKSLTEEIEESLVKSIIPSTKVEKVEKSRIDGIYKAYLQNGNILYVDTFKRLIFIGEIYTNRGFNLTADDREKWQTELKKKMLKNIKKDKLIKDAIKIDYGKGSNKYVFIIFSDPECPFCRRVENFLSKHNATIYLNYFPLPFHRNAEKWSLQILSSKDKKKAMEEIKNTNRDLNVTITKDAKDRLEKMKKLGKSVGVNGTPLIFVAEKDSNKIVDIINGANIPKIKEYLNKDRKNAKKK